MKAIVVGGGIGGLTAALMLHKAGIGVRVYESVAEVKPAGVGINLLPHSVKLLDKLGLLDALYEVAIPTEKLMFFNKFGQKIWSEPRGKQAGYRWPQFSIHRGDMQMLLYRAAVERLGQDNVLTGHHFQSFENQSGGILAKFVDQRTKQQVTDKADVLIGADGIHSSVRALMHPNEGPPIWSGIALWRAATEVPTHWLDGKTMIMAGTPPHKFICYPMSIKSHNEGHSLLNWIADIRIAEGGDAYRKEDWSKQGRVDEVLKHFEDWKFDWLDIPGLISKATSVWEFPLMDREPLHSWTEGRATLLGDAAHPMYPMGSNGAAQAILDAEAITQALVAEGDVHKALQRYEAERLPATAAIVLANRQSGPERVMKVADDLAPNGFKDIEDVMPYADRLAIADGYKRLAGFDVASVNAD